MKKWHRKAQRIACSNALTTTYNNKVKSKKRNLQHASTMAEHIEERIKQIIAYKCKGNTSAFARLMEWSTPYAFQTVRGKSLGLSPIITIVSKLPEIDARWLLTGEGTMLQADESTPPAPSGSPSLSYMLDMEKYIPFMTAEEQQQLISGRRFDIVRIDAWERKRQERNERIDAIFSAAYSRQGMTHDGEK